MEVVPFKDYSDVLVPLPPLGGEGDHASGTRAAGSSFDDRLRDALRGEGAEAGAVSTKSAPTGVRTATYDRGDGQAPAQGLDQACRDLEGFLLALLLRNLAKGFGGSDLFSGSWEGSVYKEMFFFEMAKAAGARPPGLGIAKVIQNDIILKARPASHSAL
jgi:hypothetical protein